MCLLTNNLHKYIAKKDIVCYKIVYLQGKKIISFWFDFPYELNRKYTTQVLQPIPVPNGTTIVKCIIPKGTKFYQDDECFTSSQIIIKQIL